MSKPPFRPFADGKLALFESCFLAVLILLVRKSEAFFHAQFWAEDAALFFRDSLVDGPAAIFKTYAGYFHLLPRLVAWAGSALPFEWAPLFYNLAALGIFLGLAAYLLGRFEEKWPGLFLLASVLVPHDGECFLNLTNLQWLIAPYLVLFCLRRAPETKGELAGDIVAVILTGLSGPFILFCLPLYVLRAWRKPWGYYHIWLLAAAGVALLQASALQANAAALSPHYFIRGANVWHVLVSRFGGIFLTPRPPVSALIEQLNPALLIFTVLFLLFVFWKTEKRRFAYAAVLAYAVIEVAAALWKSRGFLLSLTYPGAGERYFYFAYVLIAWFLLMAAAEKNKALARGATAFLALILFSSITHFRAASWPDLNWKENSARLRAAEQSVIPVNPPGWGLIVNRPAPDGNWLLPLRPDARLKETPPKAVSTMMNGMTETA